MGSPAHVHHRDAGMSRFINKYVQAGGIAKELIEPVGTLVLNVAAPGHLLTPADTCCFYRRPSALIGCYQTASTR